ncbi:MAG: hypothetical protein SFV54_22695 [Bryobacteraceae bacterium]|nr:hypothetical protein [Bryobacteraceae bacterium]
MPLSNQDLITIINLLMVVLMVILFPGGPGTPRHIPIPWKRQPDALPPVR